MSTPIKSNYELLMEKYEQAGILKIYNSEENRAVITDLNRGMDEFLYSQKVNEQDTQQELRGIILNA